ACVDHVCQLRLQSFALPGATAWLALGSEGQGAKVAHTLVEAPGALGPQFDAITAQAVPAPERRARRAGGRTTEGTVRRPQFAGFLRGDAFEIAVCVEHTALCADPCVQLAALRPGREVGVAFR